VAEEDGEHDEGGSRSVDGVGRDEDRTQLPFVARPNRRVIGVAFLPQLFLVPSLVVFPNPDAPFQRPLGIGLLVLAIVCAAIARVRVRVVVDADDVSLWRLTHTDRLPLRHLQEVLIERRGKRHVVPALVFVLKGEGKRVKYPLALLPLATRAELVLAIVENVPKGVVRTDDAMYETLTNPRY
jgi:hypothetical protein